MDSFKSGPFFPALCLTAILGVAAPAAAAAQSRSDVDLFIDLAGDDLGDAMQTGTAPIVDGIPLNVGVAEDPGAEGWHMVAGARGSYTLGLGNGLDLVARGNATRTTFFDDPIQDHAGATGATEFRLQRGPWQFGLTPGLAVTRWTAGAMQRDGTLDGRVSRPITDDLSITASGRYRWRVADGTESFQSEATGGRIGFTYRLAPARFELAYAARREAWSAGSGYGGPDATFAHGPSLSAAMPLDRDLKLSASYKFTETTNEGGFDTADSIDRLHQLNLGLVWDIGGVVGAFSEVALSFKYLYEHTSTTASASQALHAGTVNLAVGF